MQKLKFIFMGIKFILIIIYAVTILSLELLIEKRLTVINK